MTKSIPSNSVAVGNPAAVVSSYDEYIDRMKKKMDDCIVVNQIPAEMKEEAKKKLRDSLDNIGFIL